MVPELPGLLELKVNLAFPELTANPVPREVMVQLVLLALKALMAPPVDADLTEQQVPRARPAPRALWELKGLKVARQTAKSPWPSPSAS